MLRILLILSILLAATPAGSNEWLMPPEQFARFRNRAAPKDGSGSCVQASLAANGAHAGIPAMESLLEESPYGPAELGGSWPGRTEKYCQQRGVAIYSVEGAGTLEWIQFGLSRGHCVTITYGHAHMINVVAMRGDGSAFRLWDNNYPGEFRWVDRRTFIHEHRIHGGGWCVLFDKAGPPPWAAAREPRRHDRVRGVKGWGGDASGESPRHPITPSPPQKREPGP